MKRESSAGQESSKRSKAIGSCYWFVVVFTLCIWVSDDDLFPIFFPRLYELIPILVCFSSFCLRTWILFQTKISEWLYFLFLFKVDTFFFGVQVMCERRDEKKERDRGLAMVDVTFFLEAIDKKDRWPRKRERRERERENGCAGKVMAAGWHLSTARCLFTFSTTLETTSSDWTGWFFLTLSTRKTCATVWHLAVDVPLGLGPWNNATLISDWLFFVGLVQKEGLFHDSKNNIRMEAMVFVIKCCFILNRDSRCQCRVYRYSVQMSVFVEMMQLSSFTVP